MDLGGAKNPPARFDESVSCFEVFFKAWLSEISIIEDVKLGFIFDLCPSGGNLLKLRDYLQSLDHSEHLDFACK